jgi:hypothetical protein
MEIIGRKKIEEKNYLTDIIPKFSKNIVTGIIELIALYI